MTDKQLEFLKEYKSITEQIKMANSLANYINSVRDAYCFYLRHRSLNLRRIIDSGDNYNNNHYKELLFKAHILNIWDNTYYLDKDKALSLYAYLKLKEN